jgi:hypothetical protein
MLVCLLWRLHGSGTPRTPRRRGTGVRSYHFIYDPAGGSMIARGTRAGHKVGKGPYNWVKVRPDSCSVDIVFVRRQLDLVELLLSALLQ